MQTSFNTTQTRYEKPIEPFKRKSMAEEECYQKRRRAERSPLSTYYKIVEKVADKELFEELGKRARVAERNERLKQSELREVVLPSLSCLASFSGKNNWLKSSKKFFKTNRIKDKTIRKTYKQMLNTFGMQWKLEGEYFITLQVMRTIAFSQKWHFDRQEKNTMVAVLYNDFEQAEGGKGLDIAFNTIYGPHHPEHFEGENAVPEEGTVETLEYPVGGAITWDNAQGEVIHKMSLLKQGPLASPGKTRSIVLITVKDSSWPLIPINS